MLKFDERGLIPRSRKTTSPDKCGCRLHERGGAGADALEWKGPRFSSRSRRRAV